MRAPPPVRQFLQEDLPELTVESLSEPWKFPSRAVLFGLIAASVLTGAVSESLPGERGRRTLESLLSAGISRWELILGKWAAWSGLGTIISLFAAMLSITTGKLTMGPWIIAIPFIPMITVALGLFFVRRTADIVSGSVISLRVLPTILGTTSLISWFVSHYSPEAAAMIPLGGAVIISGEMWNTAVPFLLATGTSLFSVYCLLYLTQRDLNLESTPLISLPWEIGPVLGQGVLVLTIWWLPLVTPDLWRNAGNGLIGPGLTFEQRHLAATALLLTFVLVHTTREPNCAATYRLHRPDFKWGLTAFLLGALFVPLQIVTERLCTIHAWLPSGVSPTSYSGALPLGASIIAVTSIEFAFRGYFLRRSTPLISTALFVAIMTPQNPIFGVLIGTATTTLVMRSRSILPGIGAQITAVLIYSWFSG